MSLSQVSPGPSGKPQSGVNGSSLLPATPAYPWLLAPLDFSKLTNYLERCEWASIGYLLGGKAHNLLAIPPDYADIDCSGWVRAAVAVATGGRTILPDGSVNQHDWCDRAGLKVSTRTALLLSDDWVRLAFLVSSPGHPIGHVFLAHKRQTYESWGGHGPGSRSVLSRTSEGRLQQVAGAVYILGRAA